MGRHKKSDINAIQLVQPEVKKEEIKATTFDKQEKQLEAKLKQIQLCNKLIKIENPFTVEVSDQKLFDELLINFRQVLEAYIQEKQPAPTSITNVEIVQNKTIPATNTLNDEDYVYLKVLINKTKQKMQEYGMKETIQQQKEIKEQNKKETILDLYEGSILLLKKNLVIDNIENGEKVLFPAGSEVFVVEQKGDKLLIDRESVEGWVTINQIK